MQILCSWQDAVVIGTTVLPDEDPEWQMGNDSYGNAQLALTCPQCGAQFLASVGRLTEDAVIACTACGGVLNSANFGPQVQKAMQALGRQPHRLLTEPSSASFVYDRDDLNRRIRITARGTLQRDDFVTIVHRQADDKAWTYGLLYDLRRMSAAIPKEDEDTVAAHVSESVGAHGPRGPVALVMTLSNAAAEAQAYAARTGITVQVFGDVLEAEHWLDQEQHGRHSSAR